MAFIGGLDLCYGRWDVNSHLLADVHPGGVETEVCDMSQIQALSG